METLFSLALFKLCCPANYDKGQELFNSYSPFRSEKAMATHSGTLAWKIPWMEEPGRVKSMGSRRVTTEVT